MQFIPHTPQNSAQGFTEEFLVIVLVLPPTIPDRHKRLVIWHRVSLAPSTRRGSPAAGARQGGAEPLTATAAFLFGLSPDS